MKRIAYFIFITLILSQICFAQEKKVNRAAKTYDKYSFIKAIDIYERVANRGYKSAELFKKLGNSYYFNANYEKSAQWYKELIGLDDPQTEAEYYFRYAQSLKALKNYGEADVMMERFDDVKANDKRAALFKSQPEYLEVIKFQSGRYKIASFVSNSIYSDFAPSFKGEGLVFSSARDTGIFSKRKHTWNEADFLDLYTISEEDGNVKPTKFSRALNTKLHESTTAFTKDGSTVYFTRSNYTNGKIRRDSKGINKLKIYKATINNGNWENVTELPFNSDAFSTAHPALSPDEKSLYFASDREGSLGLSDIYKVAINADGTYGDPINLGASINTEGRETFPFLSTEGNLYFSSDGHPGLGGLDVYVVNLNKKYLEDKVFNIGTPINSEADDFTFIIDDATKKGYFASDRAGGKGNDDIYSLVELSPLKTDCEQLVKGIVTDKETSLPIAEAEVLIINKENEIIKRYKTDQSGLYELTINCSEDHFIRVQKEGYITKESFVEASFEESEISLNFELEKDTVTAGIGDDLSKLLDLKPIYFDFNKSRIRKDAEIELAKVLVAMEKYPNLKIDIRSHTDSRASDKYNLRLSERRAKATRDYLIKNGIDASRITAKGYGETELINKCADGVPCSKAEHELNRRSEFVIVQ